MHSKTPILTSFAMVISAATASALPTLPPATHDAYSAIQPVASWQYHRNCGWQGGRYIVDLGVGRIVACRPYRPSREYAWRSADGRDGWYNNRRRAWHDER